TLVESAVTSGGLRESFQKLPRDVRKRLSTILSQRKGAVPTLPPGLYGKGVRRLGEFDYFLVRHGATIDEIAHYLSGDSNLEAIIEARNQIPHDRLLGAGTFVYFPRESFKRSAARKDLSENLASGTFIYPWGGFKVSHTEQRNYTYNNI